MPYKPKTNVTTQADRTRPNYAEVMGCLILSLADEHGVSEEEYREMIKTPEGAEAFKLACAWYGVPLFMCRYTANKKKLASIAECGSLKAWRRRDGRNYR